MFSEGNKIGKNNKNKQTNLTNEIKANRKREKNNNNKKKEKKKETTPKTSRAEK
jgi:hypothetical protein